MSYDVNLVPGRSAPADDRTIADAWGAVEDAFGEDRMEALEDAGMNVVWNPDGLFLSIPYSVSERARAEFDAVAERATHEFGQRLGWVVDGDTSSRA